MKITDKGSKKILIDDCNISLKDTFDCGQCFRWTFDGIGWVGVVGKRAVRCIQQENGFIIENTTVEDVENFWKVYFDLEKDYGSVVSEFSDDEYLTSAAEYGKGIRILRQEPLETIISFIISSNNNIKRIRGIIERLCQTYGKPIGAPFGEELYAFPDNEDLSKITFEGLEPLRAGFRQKYIMDAVEKIRGGELVPEALCDLSTSEAGASLMSVKGVGQKVSDCILLFAYGRHEVFPKDVWIKRVISDIYGDDCYVSNFGANAGIIQQYLFHYARNHGTNTEKEV
ncbi:MAG: DNA-3-methyladenine glycosylase 2 family protein [Clostridia bacterium]|nr:DNA-3-methyladenine glycosylase 2 family protein [Clostridia bacterium]